MKKIFAEYFSIANEKIFAEYFCKKKSLDSNSCGKPWKRNMSEKYHSRIGCFQNGLTSNIAFNVFEFLTIWFLGDVLNIAWVKVSQSKN